MEEQGRFYLNVELFNIDAEKLFAENTGLTTGEEAKWTANSTGVLGLNFEAFYDLFLDWCRGRFRSCRLGRRLHLLLRPGQSSLTYPSPSFWVVILEKCIGR